jgi:hypothetical protein
LEAASKEEGEHLMPLTHDFKETIRARAQRDAKFRQALLREAVERILNGELDAGKAVLRYCVNATVGFQNLQKDTDIPAKSLIAYAKRQRKPFGRELFNRPRRATKDRGCSF